MKRTLLFEKKISWKEAEIMELIYKLNQWYLLNKADNLISLDPRYETSRQADLQYV